MNIPNIITGIRILLIPVFVIFLIQGKLTPSLVIFLIAGITDALDGFIARRYGQVSELGAYMDPIADKILLVSSFLILSMRNLIPDWLCVLVITRDILIILGVAILFLLQKKALRIGPSKLSKINTCIQIICILLVLIQSIYMIKDLYYQLMFWVTGFFTVSSGVHYLFEWLRYIGSEQNNRPQSLC